MQQEYLYKKDAEIILYPLIDDTDEYYSIYITHKKDRGNFYGKWLEFQPELDELGIIEEFDEWMCDKKTPREELKLELEKRGFNVELA